MYYLGIENLYIIIYYLIFITIKFQYMVVIIILKLVYRGNTYSICVIHTNIYPISNYYNMIMITKVYIWLIYSYITYYDYTNIVNISMYYIIILLIYVIIIYV